MVLEAHTSSLCAQLPVVAAIGLKHSTAGGLATPARLPHPALPIPRACVCSTHGLWNVGRARAFFHVAVRLGSARSTGRAMPMNDGSPMPLPLSEPTRAMPMLASAAVTLRPEHLGTRGGGGRAALCVCGAWCVPSQAPRRAHCRPPPQWRGEGVQVGRKVGGRPQRRTSEGGPRGRAPDRCSRTCGWVQLSPSPTLSARRVRASVLAPGFRSACSTTGYAQRRWPREHLTWAEEAGRAGGERTAPRACRPGW